MDDLTRDEGAEGGGVSGVDLVQWLGAQYDADALWAMEASRRYGEPAPEGGAHWQWEDSDTDEIIIPDPGRDEHVGGESFRVALRSRETWPTHSVGELPQFAIPEAEEVPSAVGGHIVRWDPARALREIDAKRQLLELHRPSEFGTWVGDDDDQAPACRTCGNLTVRFPCRTLRLLASVYEDRPGYQEAWRPSE